VKVQGIEVSQAHIDACLERMKRGDYFRAYFIASAAYDAGVSSGEVASRLADRLIQRERKAGRIIPVNRSGLWKYVGATHPNGPAGTPNV
jgi:hypothetical protein